MICVCGHSKEYHYPWPGSCSEWIPDAASAYYGRPCDCTGFKDHLAHELESKFGSISPDAPDQAPTGACDSRR